MNKRASKWIISVLSVLATSAFPVLFLYCSNAAEARFSEVLLPLGVFCGIGVVTLAILSLVMKSVEKAAVATCLFMLVFANYALIEDMIQRFIPWLRYWKLLPILAVVWLHVSYFIWKKLSDEICRDGVSVLAIVMIVMIVINFAVAAPAIIEKLYAWKKQLIASGERKQEQRIDEGNTDLPNIYLLVFDEYAGFRQLKENYDYDNEPLRSYLTKKRFTISENSRNDSINTGVILTNLVCMEYVVDDSVSSVRLSEARSQAALYALLEEKGYTLQCVTNGVNWGLESVLDTNNEHQAVTIGGQNMAYLCWEKTPVYPFLRSNSSDIFNGEVRVIQYLENPENIPLKPTFTFGYVCLPHEPFVVDEHGREVSLTERYNWKDKRYYLGQLKYTTKMMISAIDNILEHDPDSIIMLCSDHGARGAYGDKIRSAGFSPELMMNPLLAVYYKGEPMEEIEGLSSVNVMRCIVTRLFGETYEVVQVPSPVYQE